ncbi:hypothetical protein ACSLBF_21085 (plasmid) [Pseudoalteromonas sp. T1lg65]|uniref:hypothetical protein n=1 Tax=Pseudoalteromonas sp. T1lg65 TaxID=2077101 RepID=UPI003F79A131
MDYLFVDTRIDGRSINSEVELVTKNYEDYFLHLDRFNSLLATNVKFDLATATLTGIFWNEHVDANLKPARFLIEDGETYLALNLLDNFEIEYFLNTSKQSLSINTSDRHPNTAELIIAERKKLIEVLKRRDASQLTKHDKYQLYTAPNLDVNLSLKHQNKAGYQAYTQLTQDILYHQADIKLAKSDTQSVTGEATFSRKLALNNIPMTYQIGDIRATTSSLTQSVSRGLGLFIGQDERRSRKLQDDISGYTIPGSEVALFKDGYLVDFKQTESDGYYQFIDIDFRNADTQYYLQFTNPDGSIEKREIKKSSWQGLRQGQWTPEFVFIDANNNMLGRGRLSQQRKQQFAMLNGTYVYNPSTLIRGGVQWINTDVSNRSIPYSDVEWRGESSSVISTKLGYDGQFLYDNQVDFSIAEHSVYVLSQKRASNGITSRNKTIGHSYDSDSIKISSQLYQSSALGVTEEGFESRLGFNVNNQTHYLTLKKQIKGVTADRIAYVSSLSSKWGVLHFSYSKEYFSTPVEDVTIRYSHYFNGYNFSSSIRHETSRDDTTTKLRVSKSFRQLSLSASLSHSSKGNTIAALSMAFSFNSSNPLSTFSSSSYRRGSTIKKSAFIDHNYNGLWDKELNEPSLQGVALSGVSQSVKTIEEEDYAKLVGVDIYDPKVFQVSSESLDNPFLIPTYTSVKLESHPGGEVNVILPFQQLFEAEGEVFKQDEKGNVQRNPGFIPFELINHSTGEVREIYTEQDGFFIIDRLKKGQYALRIEADFLAQNKLRCEPCEQTLNTDLSEDFIVFTEPFVLTPE